MSADLYAIEQALAQRIIFNNLHGGKVHVYCPMMKFAIGWH